MYLLFPLAVAISITTPSVLERDLGILAVAVSTSERSTTNLGKGALSPTGDSMCKGFSPQPVSRPWTLIARRQLDSPDQPTRSSNEMWRAQDGLFYVDAIVNGAAVRFLIDTGASMIVLTAEDARRVAARPAADLPVERVETAAGMATMSRVTLDELNVGPNRSVAMPAAVAPPGLSISLLGQNWLSTFNSVTIEGDRLTLR